ncbi:hypothetical protein EYF80_059081 [Liparis tanakae]|uniref:Uncharacterized protein n=1 Tax=Liparis tanakae TaxID=230148 RepID=A0A4Z2EPP7_9TELE|nr:hypothetical protein EYF80_059081 [Liparis tanakae]
MKRKSPFLLMGPPEEDSPRQHGAGPPEGPTSGPRAVASRPVHAKMTLILSVNEVRHATRATHRPSFFVRMRFGEGGDASRASCGPRRAHAPHVESTRSRRRSGAEEEAPAGRRLSSRRPLR